MSKGFRVSLAILAALVSALLTLGLVAALGTVMWQTDGVSLCDEAGDQEAPQIVSDGAGGAIVTWRDERAGDTVDDIFAQRVDGDGNVLWITDGVTICSEDNEQLDPQLVSDGSGGAIITWYDERKSTIYTDIYAQRVDAMGNTLWHTNGFTVCDASYAQAFPQICSDGSGGAIVTWHDYRTGGEGVSASFDIYAQRVDADGDPMWQTNGVTVCTESPHNQQEPRITSDESGEAIVIWEDWRLSEDRDLFAQKLDQDGNPLWQANGVSLCVATDWQSDVDVVPDGSGGAIAVWEDHRPGDDFDIYAQRVDQNGNVFWHTDGYTVCDVTNYQSNPQLIPDGSGGAIITWQDSRTGSKDIYAQRVDANGNALWATDGVSLCVATQSQMYPQITSDGVGGAVVTWQDWRDSKWDIYAQRVDANGNSLWQANGVSLCTDSYSQMGPQIAADGYFGAIVTWRDYRSDTDYDIWAQRVGGVEEVSLPLVLRKHQ